MSKPAVYSIYVIRCGDGSCYTGIATDVQRRLAEHESGDKGARYLRGRGPLRLVYQQEVGDRGTAQRLEHRVKKLKPDDKANPDILTDRINALLADLAV